MTDDQPARIMRLLSGRHRRAGALSSGAHRGGVRPAPSSELCAGQDSVVPSQPAFSPVP